MTAWTDYLRKIRMNPNPPPMKQRWLLGPWTGQDFGVGPPKQGRGSWLGNIKPSILPDESQSDWLTKRIPDEDGYYADKEHPFYKQLLRGRGLRDQIYWGADNTVERGGKDVRLWGEEKYENIGDHYGNLGNALVPMSASTETPGWGETYGSKKGKKAKKGPTAPTAPTAEERAEAWKLAMEDAQGFMGPMQGDTIPGVAPGGGSREHQMGVYNTGGYDLTSNRPTADPDAVRKRLYGIMGFA